MALLVIIKQLNRQVSHVSAVNYQADEARLTLGMILAVIAKFYWAFLMFQAKVLDTKCPI